MQYTGLHRGGNQARATTPPPKHHPNVWESIDLQARDYRNPPTYMPEFETLTDDLDCLDLLPDKPTKHRGGNL